MRREASNFVRILDSRFHPQRTRPPARRLCLFNKRAIPTIGAGQKPSPGAVALSIVFCFSVTLVLSGCSSSPRFRSDDRGTGAVAQDENEFRYVSKIREEENREDDRKVDVPGVKKKLAEGRNNPTYGNLTPKGLDRDEFLLEVVSFLGAPYRFGGFSREGIDCSGLTSAVYAGSATGLLPRSTREQFQTGTPVEKDQLQFGDLVFFNTTGQSPSHVGIYIEDDLFAHASVTSGVTISSLESTYYKKRFLGARRLVEE